MISAAIHIGEDAQLDSVYKLGDSGEEWPVRRIVKKISVSETGMFILPTYLLSS
jgi:hypothetical protein